MRAALTHAATALAVAALVWTAHDAPRVRAVTSFAAEIERLSEPEGRFDTDNLISNEASYLDVVPGLVSGRVVGGAYIGVGPDQNFSYIARIRPTVAYIVDIRRDNLLLHLLFKALFATASTRVEYLSLLTGREPPSDPDRWKTGSISAIVSHVDVGTPTPARTDALRRQLDAVVAGFGVPLTPSDLDTIDRFHRAFVEAGLDLRFQTFGRPPQPYYPRLRDLLLATGADGRTWNYLASEDDFQFLKALHERDGIIPVVGNLAGTHALPHIATTVAARGQIVSAVYLSNVETYIGRQQFAQFVENLARLPQDDSSVVIRSIFGGGGASRSIVEPLSDRYRRSRAPGR